MNSNHPLFVILAMTSMLVVVNAFQSYQSNIPNGANINYGGGPCGGVGHTSCGGGGARNAFGNAFAGAGHQWTTALCKGDADGDGRTNGDELGDGCCTFGGKNRLFTGLLTHPGFSDATTTRDSCVLAAPANPTGLTFSQITQTGMTVTWGYPTNACACGFLLQRDDGNGGAFTTVYDTTSALDEPFVRSFTATGLASGTTFQWRISAKNHHTTASSAVTVSQATLPDTSPPSVPQNPRVDGTWTTWLTLAWDTPASIGGAPISIFEYQLALKNQIAQSNFVLVQNVTASTTRVNVTGLTNNTEYEFRVRAYNMFGASPFTSTVVTRTDDPNASAPNSPTAPTLSSKTTTSISITWTAPASNGAQITQYRVESATGSSGGTFTTAASVSSNSATITGLNVYSDYRFRVAATNNRGTSPVGAESSVIKTNGVMPAAPNTTTISDITKNSAVLTWTAPNQAGTPAFTKYVVDLRQGTSGTWMRKLTTTGTTTLSATISNLNASQLYQVRVAAESTLGTSAFNQDSFTTSSARTLTDTVGANEYKLSASFDGGAFKMSWKFLDNDEIEFAIEATTPGYAAIGFGTSMTSSDVYLGRYDNNAIAVNDMWSTGHSAPQKDTTQGGTDSVLAKSGSKSGDKLTFKFIRKLDTGDSKDTKITKGKTDIIWAIGATSGASFSKHTKKGVESVDLNAGGGKPVVNINVVIHGLFMFLAWPVCIGIGAIIARFFKWKGHVWYLSHRAIQSIGVLLSVIAFFVGTIGIVGQNPHFTSPHAIFGLIVTLLGVAQPFLGIYANRVFDIDREAPPAFPDRVHQGIGWLAISMGTVNCFFGLSIAGADPGLITGYIIWVILFVLAIIFAWYWTKKEGKYGSHGVTSDEEK